MHALSVDDADVTVWLSASDAAGAPWTNIDSTRWRRPSAAPGRPVPSDGGVTSPSDLSTACLVRAGTDADGRPLFVDLSRLDGVLSVTGEKAVARDVVQNLLAEIARTRPGTPVTVLRGTADAPPLAVPPSLQQLPQVTPQIRRTGGRPPSWQPCAVRAVRAGPGWSGLVYGETQDAHWRWYTDGHGRVDIPVLDLKLVVPA